LHTRHDWLKEEDLEDEMHHSPVYDYDTKMLLFGALQEQCHLAVLLTDLVSLVFAPRVNSPESFSVDELRRLMCTIKGIRQSLIAWEAQVQPLHGPAARLELYDPLVAMKHQTFMCY
jgi:hypothetical protein